MEQSNSKKDHYDLHNDVIESCMAGDARSFEKLYRLYSKAMFNVAFRIVNDEEDAEDVLQESFISAFKNLKSFKGEASFGAWLKRIVINRAINFIRRRKTEFENIEFHDQIADEAEEFYLTDRHQKVEYIRQAIEQLPDGYRVVFNLYMLEGYDHGEIAEILDISESTSKSQLNRSKKKLKEIIYQSHGKAVN